MKSEDVSDWKVGPWTVRQSLNRIEGPGGAMPVPPKVLATLLCLAEHEGGVVSRDTLLETVWAGTLVSDDTINRAISDLRGLLGDSAHESRVIETIRQRGYRLLVPAHRLSSASKERSAKPPGRPAWVSARGAWVIGTALLLAVLGFTRARWSDPPVSPAYRAVPLTTSPGFEFDVALSPDGEQVAFIGAAANGAHMDLFIKRIGVETPLQLTNDARIEISPAWSPDGQSIAFLGGDRPHEECGVYVMRLPGDDARKVADCQTLLVTGVSWSPDGKAIVFSDRSGRDEPFRIYKLNLEDREVTALTSPPADGFGDFSASYSPDGKRIGFIRGTTAGTTALILTPALGDIYSLNLQSGRESRLTFDNQEIAHLDWMPDGRSVVFASHRTRGTPGLWRVPLSGGAPTWLLGTNTTARKPTLARQINRMVFEEWSNEASIWQAEIAELSSLEPDAEPLVFSTQFDATPQYSPDGTRLAFTSQRSGASEIWVSRADGSHPLQVTAFGGPFTSSPRWSPDGSRLVFETRTEGQSDVYVVDAEGGRLGRLTRNPAQDMVPSWSADGGAVYFASNRSGQWQVWEKPLPEGQPRQITVGGGFLALAAPPTEAPAVYFTRIGSTGLFKMPLPGGRETRVLDDLHEDDWGNWLPSSAGIHFIRRSPTRLALFEPATSEISDLGPLEQLPLGMAGLALTPDGKTVAFVRQQLKKADLWMVDDLE